MSDAYKRVCEAIAEQAASSDAAEERARIVAWLRADAAERRAYVVGAPDSWAESREDAAQQIERGEHHEEA